MLRGRNAAVSGSFRAFWALSGQCDFCITYVSLRCRLGAVLFQSSLATRNFHSPFLIGSFGSAISTAGTGTGLARSRMNRIAQEFRHGTPPRLEGLSETVAGHLRRR